jgi:hypothetical protein
MGGVFPATAIADDGTLALRRADTRWALADVRAPGDCIIETSVDFRSGAGCGVVFRASLDETDRMTGYSFDLDPSSDGGYVVRLWEQGRQHVQPLARVPLLQPAQVMGRHLVRLALEADELTAHVDGELVLHVQGLSRSALDAGCEPCRGDRVGIQASPTSDVTVESLGITNS